MASPQWPPMTFGRPGRSMTLTPAFRSRARFSSPGLPALLQATFGWWAIQNRVCGRTHRAALEWHSVDRYEDAGARERYQHSIWSSGAGAERRMGRGTLHTQSSSRGIANAHLDRALERKRLADRLQSQHRTEQHVPIQPAVRSYGIEPDRYLGRRFLLCREWLGEPVHAGRALGRNKLDDQSGDAEPGLQRHAGRGCRD